MATILHLPEVRPLPLARPARVVAAPPLRLTRRGRRVLWCLVVLAVGLVVVATVLVASHPAAAGVQSRPMVVQYHRVLPGETLLQIAASAAPGIDPRDTAQRIIELNAMQGSQLQAGQRLALPTAG